ncbi:MAG TPA: GNAT family N-acetyltransferase [Tepidiformaceae bacterium]|jgi:GNAT superfamily N-acetyltransferase|nr:GNAT family N-acetyltransferase [Tepidiformaceae bacterium]
MEAAAAVTVRPANLGDGPAFYEAWQALRLHYANTDRRIIPAPVSQQEFLAGFRERVGRQESADFIAIVEDRVVGFISGRIEENQPDRLPERHATVGHLYVDAAYRRGGLGRRLFEEIAAWARDADGVSHFEMPVLVADPGARAFLVSLGFTPFIQRLWAPLSAPERDA